ncbi:MAG: magnesium chelatase subunit D [Myxococcota bacterium]
MSSERSTEGGTWLRAAHVLALHAIDPTGTGGVVLRGRPGPARSAWLARLAELLPSGARVRRVPPEVAIGRLVGGLDLAATLTAGRPVIEQGLLAAADGGALVLPLAERLQPAVAGAIAQALDTGSVQVERDGLSERQPARFGVIALDEGEDEQRPPVLLRDRLAFEVDLSTLRLADFDPDALPAAEDVARARGRFADTGADDEALRILGEASIALGVASLGALQRALRAARADAALRGVPCVDEEALRTAVELVLLPRATRFPVASAPEEETGESGPGEAPDEADVARDEGGAGDEPREPVPRSDASEAGEQAPPDSTPAAERVLAAVRAAMPGDLLDRLEAAGAGKPSRQRTDSGRSAIRVLGSGRGRPVGARRGRPDGRARIALVDTLRAAAPWQPLRRGQSPIPAPSGEAREPGASGLRRIEIRRDDFHVVRTRPRVRTTTIFAVDASGSTATSRLAEAKGAVERLLAESYVRRDAVAMIAFRGHRAQILLPPTRSLVRAKRELGALPAGGGTPLASGILLVLEVAEQVRRAGGRPIAVFLSDGQANVAADGSLGRGAAHASALEAARRLRSAGITALFVDTSPRPRDVSREIADAMGAAWMLLPRSPAEALAAAALGLARGPGRGASTGSAGRADARDPGRA